MENQAFTEAPCEIPPSYFSVSLGSDVAPLMHVGDTHEFRVELGTAQTPSFKGRVVRVDPAPDGRALVMFERLG